jgi:putative transposase
MIRFSFKKGLIFLCGNRRYTLVRRLSDGKLQLEGDDGQYQNFQEHELLKACSTGEWVVDTSSLNTQPGIVASVQRDLVTYSDEAQKNAKLRHQYLMRLLNEEGRLVTNFKLIKSQIETLALEFKDNNPPSPISVYRWYRRFKQSGNDMTSLADRYEFRGRRIGVTEDVRVILDEVIDTLYLHVQLYPKKGIFEELERRIRKIHEKDPESQLLYPIPSRATVYRYLNNLGAHQTDKARLGKEVADRKFRGVFQKNEAERINEWWEIDHTPLDLLIICEKTKLPLGRPWLTLALDKFSRMPMGFYLSFRSPSAHAVMECIKQGILPKDEILRSYPDITSPWKAQGLPERIVCDNGMDLHAEAFKSMCQEMGIQIQFCPAARPEYKGSVERFFRTINHNLMHLIPGTVFSNPDHRGDYPAESKACMTLDELTHVIVKWIAEVYAQEDHKGIGMTPAARWDLGAAQRVLEYPVQPEKLDVITGHPEKRRAFHYGIELHGLYYNSVELQVLRRQFGDPFLVDLKYYEADLGYVHIFDTFSKRYFKVEAIDQAYAAGLRLIQHQMITKEIRTQKLDPKRRGQLLQKKHELQLLIEKSSTNKKMKHRKKSAVISGVAMRGKPVKQLVETFPEHLLLSDELTDYAVNKRGDREEDSNAN